MVPLTGHEAPRARGFTLLELLLVLVLISLLAGLMSVTTRPDPHQALAEQARRVTLLLRLAAQESRLRRTPIAWEADLHGYRFVMDAEDGRSTFAGDDLLHERAWEPALTRLAVVDLASGTTRTLVTPQAPPLRVATAAEWVQPRWRLEMATGDTAVSVEFDANGDATPVR